MTQQSSSPSGGPVPNTPFGIALRLSALQVEMWGLAERLDEPQARIVRYSASVLNLLKREPLCFRADDVFREPDPEERVLRLIEGQGGGAS